MKKLVFFLLLFCCAVAANATHTCTICFISDGNFVACADSNAGSLKSAPWCHAPGMSAATGNASTQVPVAGDSYILCGGCTWHGGNSSATPYIGASGWNWAWSGSSGNPIYVGVDVTWFSGGSFTRPILNYDNPLWTGTGFPASCAHAESGVLVGIGVNSFVTFDNFEFTGVCWTGQSSTNGAMLEVPGGSTNIIISNDYFHGWTMTSGASDNFASIETFGGGTVADLNQFVSIVVDGQDSPHFPSGSANCQWFPNDAAGCASGQGFNGAHSYDIHNSVIRYVSNIIVTSNCHTIHDNVFEFLYDTFASGTMQQHPNVMNCLGGATGDNLYWYNNLMRHTFSTQNIFFAVRTNIYFFNNVMYDNMNSSIGSLPGGCIRMNNVSNSTVPTTAYIYNNTFGDATCQIKFEVPNSPLTAWSGTGNFQNNHLINFTALNQLYICNTALTCTINDNGNEIFQTTASATAQGYVAGNNYAPTASGNVTVGAGNNNTSLVATFSPVDSAYGSGFAGVSLQSGSGGEVPLYPSITINPRPAFGSWDSGAYQFASAMPQVVPFPITLAELK